MGQAELRAVFKLINSPDNKKVLDDNKQDIQRAFSGAFKRGSTEEYLSKLTPNALARALDSDNGLRQVWEKMTRNASKSFVKGLRDVGGKDLAKIFSMGAFNASGNTIKGLAAVGGKDLAKVMGLPDIGDLSKGTIKGLRDVSGKDLAKILGLPDINDIGKYKGATPPIIADVERERLKKIGLGIITSMFNPLIGSRLLSDAVGGGAGGRGGAVSRGIFGAGGAFGFSEFYIAITGIKKAIQLIAKGLEWGADQIKKAIEFAHNLYGKSLESGLNLRFTASRQMAASALGVDEKDVFRFRQGAQVMRQLSDAVDTISKDAPILAYTSTQFKILQDDILALGSDIGVRIAPAMDMFIESLDTLVKNLKKHIFVIDFLGRSLVEGPLKAAAESLLDLALSAADEKGGGLHSLGRPQSFLKQLPAGAFEKMGLIIGGGMADKALEYQRRTATAVEKLYQAATKTNQKSSGYYMGRNPFVAGP